MEKRSITPQKRVRNYGVDILKMLSMFMVVILHTQGNGGILNSCQWGSANHRLVYLIEITAYCAVDIFGMVSGYLIVSSKKSNIFKFVPLWLNVVFYTFSITMGFLLIPGLSKYQEIHFTDIKNAIFPAITRQYWYFNSYFALYLFIPYINIVLHNIGQKKHKQLIFTIITVYSVLPIIIVFSKNDNFTTYNGYSQWWLGCLYVIGAYFKLYPVKISKILLLFSYVFCILIVWLSLYYQKLFYLLNYESVFILLSGISLFLFFIQVEIKFKVIQKILVLGSSVSFSVYIIHYNPHLTPLYLDGRTKKYKDDPTMILALKILLTAATIYTTCSVIDLFRYYLFKLLKVNNLPRLLENLYNKIMREDNDKKEQNNNGQEVVNTNDNNNNHRNSRRLDNTDIIYKELSVEVIPNMDKNQKIDIISNAEENKNCESDSVSRLLTDSGSEK